MTEESQATFSGSCTSTTSSAAENDDLTPLTLTLPPDTPQYYINPKTLEVSIGRSTDSSTVPFCGYVDEADFEKATEIIRAAYLGQVNALQSDRYTDEPADAEFVTNCEKRKSLCEVYDFNPFQSLNNSFPNIPIYSRQEVTDLNKPGKQSTRQAYSRKIKQPAWLHVPMPKKFNYTTVIMLNNATHGLLHVLVRHLDQWLQHIPQLWGHYENLDGKVKEIMGVISEAPTSDAVKDLLDDFHEQFTHHDQYLDKTGLLDDEGIITLVQMQLLIYNYLKQNIRYTSYLGEQCNHKREMKVLFLVDNEFAFDKHDVMLAAISNNTYYSERACNDTGGRKLRIILTICEFGKIN